MSVKKFSDFPYYMLYDYFAELMTYYNNKSTSTSNTVINVYNKVTFESPWLDFTSNDDFLDFGSFYDTKESYTTNVRLKGPKTNIIAQGGEYTTVYAKIDSYGYKPIGIRPTVDENWIDENWFNYEKKEYNSNQLGIFTKDEATELVNTIITENKKTTLDIENSHKIYVGEKVNNTNYCVIEHISSNDDKLKVLFDSNLGNILTSEIDIFKSEDNKTFALKKWKSKEVAEEVYLSSEDEIYLRKDSFFYKWFSENLKKLGDTSTNNGLNLLTDEEKAKSKYFVWNHENYINDNVMFNFFGCIWQKWPSENKWKIYHRSLKDFMIEAIPFNDMGLNFKIFTWELFDRIYQEIYNMQKNVYTLLDPEETYTKFLGFLSLFYGIDLDNLSTIPEKNQRWYIRNLPNFLKKKGTWASLWISWQCIIDKNNDIKFYERWHLKNKISKMSSINIEKHEVIDV